MRNILLTTLVIIAMFPHGVFAQLRIPNRDYIYFGDTSDIGIHRYLGFSIRNYNKLQWKLDNTRQFRVAVDGTYATIDGINRRIRFYNPHTGTYNSIQVYNTVQRSPLTSMNANGFIPLRNGLEQISGLQPVIRETASGEGGNMRTLSIAPVNLKENVPELFHKEADGNSFLDVDGMVPVLVNALQSLGEEVKLQKEEIGRLSSGNVKSRQYGQMTAAKAREYNDCLLAVSPGLLKNRCNIRYVLPNGYSKARISICSASGRNLYDQAVNQDGKIAVNCGGWMPGTYMCSLIIDGTIVSTQKVIKQ